MLVNETARNTERRDAMAVEVVVEAAPARRRFTREEYHRMFEVGILGPTEKLELIRGEIVKKMAPGRRHRAFVDNLTQLLVVRLAGRAIVSVQNPVALSDDTEPEPDVQILRRRSVPYKEREAFADDTLLVIEVAESSLAYDRSRKLALYAEAGVPEYWGVNCVAESIELNRRPEGSRYLDVQRVEGTAPVTLQAFADVTLMLAEIFA
jgi:Uma2 family endonuclease